MQILFIPEQSALMESAVQEGRYRDPKDALDQAPAPWVKLEQARLE